MGLINQQHCYLFYYSKKQEKRVWCMYSNFLSHGTLKTVELVHQNILFNSHHEDWFGYTFLGVRTLLPPE